VEKDALKVKKENAKRMEKEAARLEKLSKSNERLGGRSGSLERRKSGEETVTNQFTIHGENFNWIFKSNNDILMFSGIASPNKRPTLFDVFRRKGSDGKKEKESGKVTGSESNSSAGSGGIMSSVKQVITKSAEAPEPGSKKAVKDGSAHPHAGSDARVRKMQGKLTREEINGIFLSLFSIITQ
jgi:hypothetical protein